MRSLTSWPRSSIRRQACAAMPCRCCRATGESVRRCFDRGRADGRRSRRSAWRRCWPWPRCRALEAAAEAVADAAATTRTSRTTAGSLDAATAAAAAQSEHFLLRLSPMDWHKDGSRRSLWTIADRRRARCSRRAGRSAGRLLAALPDAPSPRSPRRSSPAWPAAGRAASKPQLDAGAGTGAARAVRRSCRRPRKAQLVTLAVRWGSKELEQTRRPRSPPAS